MKLYFKTGMDTRLFCHALLLNHLMPAQLGGNSWSMSPLPVNREMSVKHSLLDSSKSSVLLPSQVVGYE